MKNSTKREWVEYESSRKSGKLKVRCDWDEEKIWGSNCWSESLSKE